MDTALAVAPQPLVVRVRGADGEPLAGVTLQATGLPHDTVPARTSMVVAPAFTDAGYAPQVSTTSDANGYAQFAVRLGGVAGNGAIEIRVTTPTAASLPRDTARFTIRSGKPRQFLLAPRDTVLFVGGVARPRVRMTDLGGNFVPDAPAPSFEASSAHISVSTTGEATGAAFGRTWMRVRAAGVLDSVAISVVPQGVIAARVGGAFGSLSGVAVVSVNLDGSNPQLLVSSALSGSGDYIPDWDPTGARIVIDASPEGQRLYTYTIGGSSQRVMPAANGLSEEFRPQYSNDGWIYFVGRSTASPLGIHRVRTDGTGLSRLTSVQGVVETHPSPSPDGTQVVVMSTDRSDCTACGDYALRILNVSTMTSTSLGVGGFWPRWSPRGDLIAFLTGNNMLAVVRPDGSGQRIISNEGRRYDDAIDWSPDGQWIIAQVFGGAVLHLIEVESSLTLPLALNVGMLHPAWRP
jgi:hypothetical protein